MLRADYNHIIDSYLVMEQDINEIDAEYSIAMEADGEAQTSAPTTQATNIATGTTANGTKAMEINAKSAAQNTTKDNAQSSVDRTAKLQNAVNAVKQFLKKIGDLIDAVKRWLGNRIRSLTENDRSFTSRYNKQKQLVKPLESVQVVNYSYENAKLEQPFQNLMRDVQKTLATLSFTNGAENSDGRVSAIIQASQGSMIEELVKPYTKNAKDPITTIPAFVKYVVNEYRGEKQERTYMSKDVSAIEKNAMSTAEIRSRCNAYINESTRRYGRIRNLERELLPSTDPKVITQVRENARKAAVLYNAYNSLIHMYFELRLEQSMNYRIILKKLYQM